MKLLLPVLIFALFSSGCTLMVGAAAGGAAGYYAGEKGYKVKIEKEE